MCLLEWIVDSLLRIQPLVVRPKVVVISSVFPKEAMTSDSFPFCCTVLRTSPTCPIGTTKSLIQGGYNLPDPLGGTSSHISDTLEHWVDQSHHVSSRPISTPVCVSQGIVTPHTCTWVNLLRYNLSKSVLMASKPDCSLLKLFLSSLRILVATGCVVDWKGR